MTSQKITRDLKFLELLAADIEAYLMSDTIFWKTTEVDLPDLTLGGYLMRQHRLLALRDTLLDPAEQARLDAAVRQFDRALDEKAVLFEKKAQRELEARLRQWAEYLKELEEEESDNAAYYSTAVEVRAIIAALADKLQANSYHVAPKIYQKIEALDQKLRQSWQMNDFVWPASWQPAYPQARYWWLFGQPA